MKPINSIDAAIDAYFGQSEDFRLAIAESLLDLSHLKWIRFGAGPDSLSKDLGGKVAVATLPRMRRRAVRQDPAKSDPVKM